MRILKENDKKKKVMKGKRPTQKQMIRQWLEDGKTITPLTALKEFNCLSLAQRIKNLRDEGMPILTTFKTDYRSEKTFAEYSLIQKP